MQDKVDRAKMTAHETSPARVMMTIFNTTLNLGPFRPLSHTRKCCVCAYAYGEVCCSHTPSFRRGSLLPVSEANLLCSVPTSLPALGHGFTTGCRAGQLDAAFSFQPFLLQVFLPSQRDQTFDFMLSVPLPGC